MGAFKLAVAINLLACLLLVPDILRNDNGGMTSHPGSVGAMRYNGF